MQQCFSAFVLFLILFLCAPLGANAEPTPCAEYTAQSCPAETAEKVCAEIKSTAQAGREACKADFSKLFKLAKEQSPDLVCFQKFLPYLKACLRGETAYFRAY